MIFPLCSKAIAANPLFWGQEQPTNGNRRGIHSIALEDDPASFELNDNGEIGRENNVNTTRGDFPPFRAIVQYRERESVLNPAQLVNKRT